MSYRYSVDRDKKRGFAYNMDRIGKFCKKHGITKASHSESYYFTINGQKYRVSNHTIEESNAGAFDAEGNQVRELFHPDGMDEDTIYISAGKNKIIEIYKKLQQSKPVKNLEVH